MIGICKLCSQRKELQKSHAIGRSVFNRVLKPAANNLILHLSPKMDDIKYSSDQWDTYQLCSDCEQKINNKYENYSLNALRGKYQTIPKSVLKNGVLLSNLDNLRVKLYFLSIMWRAAESEHPSYAGISLRSDVSGYFRELFLNDRAVSEKIFNVRLRVVRDDEGLVDLKGLQQIIVAPHMYKTPNNIVFEMLFEGWLVEIYFKKPNHALLKQRGFLNNETCGYISPYVDFSEIPSLMQSLVKGKQLTERGKFKIR